MKLSIITVNLNNKDGLQKTIDSVVSQTFKDFEWIVIDGGSTDGSKELLEQYADHFAYWVSEPDKGIYNAMNKGIKVAKGEYLQFLNSGDWLCDKITLEQCFSHGFTADVVYGDLFFYKNGEISESVYPENVSLKFFYQRSLGHPASFIRRELLMGNPYEETYRIVSDWLFFLKQALNNKSFEHINEFVVYFDLNGLSSTNGDLLINERSELIKEYFPQMLISDYNTMEMWENDLKDQHVVGVMKYGGKKKLYHKMITGCLRFIGFLDKVFGPVTTKNQHLS